MKGQQRSGGSTDDSGWLLFSDWCTSRTVVALPASSETVQTFLRDVPCSEATAARRVRAINRVHVEHGYPKPTPAPPAPTPAPRVIDEADPIGRALAVRSDAGWEAKLLRDCAALVLIGVLRLSLRTVVRIRCSDLSFQHAGSTHVTVRVNLGSAASPRSQRLPVPLTDDPASCPACALARWSFLPELQAGVSVSPGHDGHWCTAVTALGTPSSTDVIIAAIDRWGTVDRHRPVSATAAAAIARDALWVSEGRRAADDEHKALTRSEILQVLTDTEGLQDSLDERISDALTRVTALLDEAKDALGKHRDLGLGL